MLNHMDLKTTKTVAPDLQVKSRKVYSGKIDDLFDTKKKELIENLAVAHRVCLTIDHWSNFRKEFVGITAHWYTNDLERHNACIALRRVTGRCTYDVLARLIEAVIVEYNIARKVTHCVTDSGSNFVKAFAEFGGVNAKEIICQSTSVDDCVAKTVYDILDCDANEKTYTLPSHCRCAAYRLSLIATKDSTKALSDPTYKSIYRSLTGKLSAIWNKQSSTVLSSENLCSSRKTFCTSKFN